MEHKTKIGDLAKTSKDAELKVQEWLAVLARCFQLHDAIAVLELDRVLDGSPDELDRHRLALRAARQNRMELISRSTERLMARMNSAAGAANTKVRLHPTKSPAVVHSRDHIAIAIVDFHGRLGIGGGRKSLEARRWVDAAEEVRDKVLETGAEGVDAARHLGNETLDRARSVTGKLSSGIARASAPSARGRRRARRARLSQRRPLSARGRRWVEGWSLASSVSNANLGNSCRSCGQGHLRHVVQRPRILAPLRSQYL